MSKVREFLSGLNEYELAYFVKYKLSTYMEDTQLEIQNYIQEKGLTESKIEKLIAANPKRESKKGMIRCPRCSSNKVRTEKVEWTNTVDHIGVADEVAVIDGFEGKATYKNQVICNVCGFWIVDPNLFKNEKPFWHYIADVLFGLFTR